MMLKMSTMTTFELVFNLVRRFYECLQPCLKIAHIMKAAHTNTFPYFSTSMSVFHVCTPYSDSSRNTIYFFNV